jgi:hypothetical protein
MNHFKQEFLSSSFLAENLDGFWTFPHMRMFSPCRSLSISFFVSSLAGHFHEIFILAKTNQLAHRREHTPLKNWRIVTKTNRCGHALIIKT